MLRGNVLGQVWPVAFAVLLLPGGACRSAAHERQQLASPNPLEQVSAAVALADAGDASAVPRLVSLLDDRDRTVRMYAILALERLCGQTYDYKYYEAEPERAEAIGRWQNALRCGELTRAAPRVERAARSTQTAPADDADPMADKADELSDE